jgi:hypothetical protein
MTRRSATNTRAVKPQNREAPRRRRGAECVKHHKIIVYGRVGLVVRGLGPSAMRRISRCTRLRLMRSPSQTCTANPLGGAPRIHGELLKLGIDVSQATIGRYMLWRPKRPSPTWRSFWQNRMADTAAVDMFVVATATFKLLYAGRVCVRSTYPKRTSLTCHSITSSANASSSGGTVRPSAFAVLRLMFSSNFVG